MTVCLIAAGVALALGAAAGWLARGDTVAVLRQQLHQAREAEAIATDRLVHAWKEGATIAPRPLEEIPPPQPLPAELQAELAQWEDSEHRIALEQRMRAGMQKGLSTTAILLDLDNLHP